jgi:phosphatidylglycerol:prolipoprotein diacylglycerol transferase
MKGMRLRPGTMVCLFLAGYGILRFLAEFFRQPDPQIGLLWGVLSMGQMLCLAMIFAAVILWTLLKEKQSGVV